MTSFRHLDDQKRGFPTTVGPLAKLILRNGLQNLMNLDATGRAARTAVLEERQFSDGQPVPGELGDEWIVLQALENLTPGQLALLRHKVHRG